jgi:hypothetical protein
MKTSYATCHSGMHMLYPIQMHIHAEKSSMKTLTILNTFSIVNYAFCLLHSFLLITLGACSRRLLGYPFTLHTYPLKGLVLQ